MKLANIALSSLFDFTYLLSDEKVLCERICFRVWSNWPDVNSTFYIQRESMNLLAWIQWPFHGHVDHEGIRIVSIRRVTVHYNRNWWQEACFCVRHFQQKAHHAPLCSIWLDACTARWHDSDDMILMTWFRCHEFDEMISTRACHLQLTCWTDL
jgi:hypothetical protein